MAVEGSGPRCSVVSVHIPFIYVTQTKTINNLKTSREHRMPTQITPWPNQNRDIKSSLRSGRDSCALLNRKVTSNFVIKFWHSLYLWCFQDNWELVKQKKRLNHDDVIDLLVVVCSVFFPKFPVILNSSQISQLWVSSCFERGRSHAGLTAWPMLNVYHFKLGKETLKTCYD